MGNRFRVPLHLLLGVSRGQSVSERQDRAMAKEIGEGRSDYRPVRRMVEPGGSRVFQLPCHPRKQPGSSDVSSRGGSSVDVRPEATKPTPPDHLESSGALGQCLVTQRPHPAPIPKGSFLRQAPQVGPVCGKPLARICAGGPGQPASLPRPKKEKNISNLAEQSVLLRRSAADHDYLGNPRR
jgi:hypothetical protein